MSAPTYGFAFISSSYPFSTQQNIFTKHALESSFVARENNSLTSMTILGVQYSSPNNPFGNIS